MKTRSILAACLAAAILLFGLPATPAQANGAASTRNIIIFSAAAAAATYLIVRHNRKVHEREAAASARQAELEQQSNNEASAYQQAHHAYQEELTVNSELQKEAAYQHSVVEAQQKELVSLGVHADSAGNVSMVSYGWGTV
jgi:Skp family chaperone for outer membrane proteins